MTDIDVAFLPKYHNMDPARLYVMILTSPPFLPLSRPWVGLGELWPSQSHPVTQGNRRTANQVALRAISHTDRTFPSGTTETSLLLNKSKQQLSSQFHHATLCNRKRTVAQFGSRP